MILTDLQIRGLLLLIPITLGVFLLLSFRRDKRRQFIQNRLKSLNQPIETTPTPSLALLGRKTIVMVPARFRALLNVVFETTGHSIKFVHLPIAAVVAASFVVMLTRFMNLGSGFIVTIMAAAGAFAAPLLLIRLAQARYQRRFLEAFPDALDLVGRSVKAGLPVNEALLVAGQEIADPVGKELRHAFDQVQIGVPMIDALGQTANRVRIPDFRFMVVALALQEKTGGSLAETLNNLSTVIRARKALRLKARALSAEAKVSAMILGALPFLVASLMYLINRDLARVLIVDPRGRFMVGVAFFSLVIGMIWMVVTVKRAMR